MCFACPCFSLCKAVGKPSSAGVRSKSAKLRIWADYRTRFRDRESVCLALVSPGTKGVEWVWFDGGMKFEKHLKLETAAQEIEEYFIEPYIAALVREYQKQEGL